MKTISALILAVWAAGSVTAAPAFDISDEYSHPSACLNVTNPVTNRYLRQAEFDTSEMLDYLGSMSFETIVRKNGPCQTSFVAMSESAVVTFVFSTISGSLVGFDAKKYEAGFQLPKIDGIHF